MYKEDNILFKNELLLNNTWNIFEFFQFLILKTLFEDLIL